MDKVFDFLKDYNRNNNNNIMNEKNNRMKKIWLNISDICDLKCIYCSSYCDDEERERTPIMTYETAKESIDDAIKTFGTSEIKISFFGGEPLLNYDLIKQVVLYCEANNYNTIFSISTNALNLNAENIRFFKDKNFTVQISIDGPQDIQKIQRPHRSSNDSYKNFEENIKLILSNIDKNNIVARSTYTPKNLCLVNNVEYFLNLGFKNIHFEPNISRGVSELNLSNYLNDLEKEIEDLVKIFFNKIETNEINELLPISNYYDTLLGKVKTHRCEGGENRFSYDVKGRKFPCHMVNNAEENRLSKALETRKNKCNNCIYNKVCQGLCLGAIYHTENDYELQCKINRIFINTIIKQKFLS